MIRWGRISVPTITTNIDIIYKTHIIMLFETLFMLLLFILDVTPVHATGEIRTYKSTTRNYLEDQIVEKRVLWTEEGVRNSLKCMEVCKEDSACVSFFFNKNTKFCQGHSITIGLNNGSTSDLGNKYYVAEEGESYIGDACTTSSDCYINDTECREGACWCAPGYSFWPRNMSCIDYCTDYGNDFTEVFGYFLSQNNEETHNNVSFHDCAQLCTTSVNYTCVTFEYGWQTNNCYLQSVTKLDKPGQWYADTLDRGFGHYQRDCV